MHSRCKLDGGEESQVVVLIVMQSRYDHFQEFSSAPSYDHLLDFIRDSDRAGPGAIGKVKIRSYSH